jgi:hypothetical protein
VGSGLIASFKAYISHVKGLIFDVFFIFIFDVNPSSKKGKPPKKRRGNLQKKLVSYFCALKVIRKSTKRSAIHY